MASIGTLVVVVLKARNLPNPGLYKQSPYCLVRLGGGGKTTQPDPKGGQHPVWDAELHFPLYESSLRQDVGRILKVTCYAPSGGKVDDPLGSGEVSIEDCVRVGEFDGACLSVTISRTYPHKRIGWVPLSNEGMQRGEVYLEMTFFVRHPSFSLPKSIYSPPNIDQCTSRSPSLQTGPFRPPRPALYTISHTLPIALALFNPISSPQSSLSSFFTQILPCKLPTIISTTLSLTTPSNSPRVTSPTYTFCPFPLPRLSPRSIVPR